MMEKIISRNFFATFGDAIGYVCLSSLSDRFQDRCRIAFLIQFALICCFLWLGRIPTPCIPPFGPCLSALRDRDSLFVKLAFFYRVKLLSPVYAKHYGKLSLNTADCLVHSGPHSVTIADAVIR